VFNNTSTMKNILNYTLIALLSIGLGQSINAQTPVPVVLGDYVFTAAEDTGGNYTSMTFSAGVNLGYGWLNGWSSSGTGVYGSAVGFTPVGTGFIITSNHDDNDTIITNSSTLSRTFLSQLKSGDRVICDVFFYDIRPTGLVNIIFKNGDNPLIKIQYVGGADSGSWRFYEGVNNQEVIPDNSAYLSVFRFQPTTINFIKEGNTNYTLMLSTSSGSEMKLMNRVSNVDLSNIDAIEFNSIDQSTGQAFGFNNLKIESKYTVGLSTDGSSSNFILDTATTADQTVTAPLFEIRNSSSLTVPATGSLEVDGVLQNDGALVLESVSDDFSSFMFGNSGSLDPNSTTGTVTYKRHANGLPANDLLASPLGTISFDGAGGFADLNTGILPANGDLRLFGDYTTSSNSFATWDARLPNTITPGKGYLASVSNNAATDLLSFQGTLDHLDDDFTVNLDYIDSTFNWNLIGNPYPSYLDIDTFLGDPDVATSNVNSLVNGNQAIYGYKQTAENQSGTDKWEIVNLATITEDGAITSIAPGQGFFVRSANPDGGPAKTITFTPAMQTKTGGDDFMLNRSTSQANTGRLKIKLENGSGQISHTRFYFLDTATDGMDAGYDAGLFFNSRPQFGLYSQLLEGYEDLLVGVQALHTNSYTNTVIPLGVEAVAGMQLTFSIADLQLPDNVTVELHDTANQTYTNLKQSDHVLTLNNATTGTGRFYINLQQQTLSTNQNAYDELEVRAPKNTNTLIVSGSINQPVTLTLFDVMGRKVLEHNLKSGLSLQQIPINNIATGAFIARLSGSEGSKSFKLIIN
jgi:hypothetical protein